VESTLAENKNVTKPTYLFFTSTDNRRKKYDEWLCWQHERLLRVACSLPNFQKKDRSQFIHLNTNHCAEGKGLSGSRVNAIAVPTREVI
jgi:hypothetical protein